jgi:hypothetical protein
MVIFVIQYFRHQYRTFIWVTNSNHRIASPMMECIGRSLVEEQDPPEVRTGHFQSRRSRTRLMWVTMVPFLRMVQTGPKRYCRHEGRSDSAVSFRLGHTGSADTGSREHKQQQDPDDPRRSQSRSSCCPSSLIHWMNQMTRLMQYRFNSTMVPSRAGKWLHAHLATLNNATLVGFDQPFDSLGWVFAVWAY